MMPTQLNILDYTGFPAKPFFYTFLFHYHNIYHLHYVKSLHPNSPIHQNIRQTFVHFILPTESEFRTNPLEWGAAPEEVILPEPIQSVFWKQITKGEFLDTIFDCPFEIHELVEDFDIAESICELKDVHKEVLYYSAIRQYSNQRIACIRKQTDRNILKVKNTILKKLRKKLYISLCERQQMNLPLCRREKEFLEKYFSVFSDSGQNNLPKPDTVKGKQSKK